MKHLATIAPLLGALLIASCGGADPTDAKEAREPDMLGKDEIAQLLSAPLKIQRNPDRAILALNQARAESKSPEKPGSIYRTVYYFKRVGALHHPDYLHPRDKKVFMDMQNRLIGMVQGGYRNALLHLVAGNHQAAQRIFQNLLKELPETHDDQATAKIRENIIDYLEYAKSLTASDRTAQN